MVESRFVVTNKYISNPLAGARDKLWQRQLVADRALFPQPWFADVSGDKVGRIELGEFMLARPGSYVLKPRFGSNGVGIIRVVSDGVRLVATSNCPDTAYFLDECSADPLLQGCDVVAAAATQRARFVNRATAGLPDWAMELSILEDEIRQDRADGSIFEPRVVAQRIDADRFLSIGAICKRVEAPIASVAAGNFCELPLEQSLRLFLAPRVPPNDLDHSVRGACDHILSTGNRAATVIAPIIAARGLRVHQFAVDSRVCWNREANEVECWFLEFQFGIGRIDVPTIPGYRSPSELRERFGPEVG
jgi:hypothetical protein